MPYRHYKLTCTTEDKDFVLQSYTVPTECPVDSGHTIGTVVPVMCYEHTVQVADEVIRTGRNLCFDNRKLSVAAGPDVDTTENVSFVTDASITSVSYVLEATHADDLLTVEIDPELKVGTITSDVSITDTVINVSAGVVSRCKVGYYLTLEDSPTKEELGRIVAIDKTALTVTVENGATNAFTVAGATEVKVTRRVMNNYVLAGTGNFKHGTLTFATLSVPKDGTLRIIYTNKSGSTKDFVFTYEYMY